MARTRIQPMVQRHYRILLTAMILLGALLGGPAALAQYPTPSPRSVRRPNVAAPMSPRALNGTPTPTPAPVMPGATPTPPPFPTPPGAVAPAPPPGAPGQPGQPGQPGRPGMPPPGAAPTPATAPSTLYEAMPTTVSVRKMGVAPAEAAATGETLPTAEPAPVRISLALKAKTVDEIFNNIREKYGVRIKAQGATGSVQIPQLIARDIPLETFLDQLARERQWRWVLMADGTYEMHDKDSIKILDAQQLRIKVFQLHFIEADEMLKVVESLKTPELGAVAADTRSNKLIVTDVPSKIALIDSLVKEYDVQVYTHVFEIKHATVDSIQQQLETVKSKAGEMHIDPINRVIIVKDTFDKIKMMEQLVQILDRDTEMRVYNMLNLGTDGQGVEDFVSKFIEPLKSQSDTAVMQYSRDTGKLFVRDVRSVHEKIIQIMRQVDVPRKQVRIEGEIVSVAVSHDLKIGTEWTLSPNLKDAINLGQNGTKSFLPGTSSNGTTMTSFNTKGLPIATIGSNGLNVIALTDDVKAQLNAALTDTRTRLLLRPRITIANNEEGRFQVIRSEPVLSTFNYGYSTGINNSASSQQTYDSGLQVMIKPNISNRGLVEMQISFVNSTPIIVDNIGNGVRGVGSNQESAETVCIIPSGETRVIGGMISRDNSDGQSGVPYLAQLPYLGFLFGQKSKTTTMRNLMFFVTPTIVEERPLNDLMVEPVNETASISMQHTQQESLPPASVSGSEIPPELRPYLKEVMPEAKPLPLPGGSLETTATLSQAPLPGELSGLVSDETPTTASMASGNRYLSAEPFSSGQPVASGLRMGGAMPGSAAPISGPSGVFGEGGATGGAKGAVTGGTAKTAARAGAPGTAGTGRTGSSRSGSSGQSSFGNSQYSSRLRGGSGSSGFGSGFGSGMGSGFGRGGYGGETNYR